MRDPARIPRIGAKLIAVWEMYPDWRLGQLISNLRGPGPQDGLLAEDAFWERRLDEIIRRDLPGTVRRNKL